MALYDVPQNGALAELTISAVLACNDRLRALEEERQYIGTHFHLAKVEINEFGFPIIARVIGTEGPTDYKGPFGPKAGQWVKIAYRDVTELAALIDFFRGETELRDRLVGDLFPPRSNVELNETFTEVSAALFALEILDQARHRFGTDLDEQYVRSLYLEREPELVLDELPVEVVVPVVVTKFDSSDRVELTEGVDLVELTLDDHLGRALSTHERRVHEYVAGAATHALVWRNRVARPKFDWFVFQPGFFPEDDIDLFFAALRVVQEQPVGYAQVLLRPVGWAYRWLPNGALDLYGVTRRRYPPSFEQTGWRWSVTPVPTSTVREAADAYVLLRDADDRNRLAARRLNSALLRDRDDDAILDLCIGLETMLGERGSVTHKLALRLAALSSISNLPLTLSPRDAFRAMKRVYAHRSDLVHGARDMSKNSVFTDERNVEHDTLALASEFLRIAIAVLLRHPRYLDSQAIELALLDQPLSAKDVDAALEMEAHVEEVETDGPNSPGE